MTLTQAAARRNLEALLEKYGRLSEPSNLAEKRAMSEASVVRQFIDILLRDVLDWPIEDTARYHYELHTSAGRPDMTLTPEKGGVIFVEAKKFGVIKPLQSAKGLDTRVITPQQMALPGMSVDRTPEEQQAINYAFQNGGEWAILTNFEVLRVFNARRDWMVIAFENPYQYRDEFDQLWQLAYPNVLNGSLDALSNQRVAPNIDSDYLAFINEWRQRLAEDLLSRRDKNAWLFDAGGALELGRLRAVVQQFLDRLVITRFAEDWLVIRPGTLRQFYELSKTNEYAFTLDEQLDRFFRRFDETHNSALFARGLVDEASFSDAALLPLIEKLYEVRYRAMPADILGNTYEQYLGKTLALDGDRIATRDNLETRKKQGSYYTPQVIVRYLVAQSLGRYLYATEDGTPDGTPLAGEARKTTFDLRHLRVLDSACGSGSFLIEAYYVLKDFYEREIVRLTAVRNDLIDQLARAAGGDTQSLEVEARRLAIELERLQNYPRVILETHIYGVDLDPQAAEVAVVNLIMRAMERSTGDKRLPLLLNQNVKVGNGLVGLKADDPRMAEHAPALADILRLRAQLVQTPHGAEHDRIVGELAAKSSALRAALDALIAPQFSDLSRVRPFHWGLEFPEVFYNDDGTPRADGGFAVILGNPPWEIMMPDENEFYAQFDATVEHRLQGEARLKRISELDAEQPYRRVQFSEQKQTIEESAAYFDQSPDYSAQGSGHTATHKLFTERMYRLLKQQGRLGYVIPSGIYTDAGTRPLREMLLNEGNIETLIGLSNVRGFFREVDSRFKFSLLSAQKGQQRSEFPVAFRIDLRVGVEPDELPAFVANPQNFFIMRRDVIKRFDPDGLTIMEFQRAIDYELVEKFFSGFPTLGEVIADKWNIRPSQELNMTTDSNLFHSNSSGLPLYEGKMFHQFDAFFAAPRYWVNEDAAAKRVANKTRETYKRPRLAFRDVSNSTNERTVISAILPPNSFAGHTAIVETQVEGGDMLYLCAVLNSFCFDWIARFKVGSHVTMSILKSLPLPRLTTGDPAFDAIVPRAARLTCTRPEYADLWQQVMGSAWQPASGATDPAERQRLRDEIDLLVAKLYGLSRDDFAHILTTFPLVFPANEAGEAKRAALLAGWDAVE
jgi:hypothetical protein